MPPARNLCFQLVTLLLEAVKHSMPTVPVFLMSFIMLPHPRETEDSVKMKIHDMSFQMPIFGHSFDFHCFYFLFQWNLLRGLLFKAAPGNSLCISQCFQLKQVCMNLFKGTYLHRLTEATSQTQCPTSCPVGIMADSPELGDALYTADWSCSGSCSRVVSIVGFAAPGILLVSNSCCWNKSLMFPSSLCHSLA